MPPPGRLAARYLAAAAVAAALLTALAAAVTVAADPYYLHGSAPIEGFNRLKPAAAQKAYEGKRALAARLRPRTLLLGNSRMEAGLDPESPLWPASLRPVFNGGLAGSGPSTALAFLTEALARGVDPALLVVGVDVLDFLAADPDAGAPEREARLAATDTLAARARHLAEATLSISALADAVRTIAAQGWDGTDTLTPSGFNPLFSYARFARRHGLHELFEIKRAEYALMLGRLVPRGFDPPEASGSFRSLIALLALARRHGIEVVLVAYPYHAQLLDLLRAAGLWDSLESWKRALVAVAAGAGGGVRVVDFAAYAPETMAAVPPRGDTTLDGALYWELSHFTAALGERMIGAILGREEGFGVALAPGTVEAVIAAQRSAARVNAAFGDTR
jgi:hypothetical protein